MLEEIDRCAAAGISFAFETTLAGKGYRSFETLYRPLVSEWQTIDNGGPVPRLLSEGGRP